MARTKLQPRSDKQSRALYLRLAKRVLSDFKINENGGVSAPALAYSEVLGLFPLCLRVRGPIPSHLVRRAISQAVKGIIEAGEALDLAHFAGIADKALRKKRSELASSFAMWSDLNLIWQPSSSTVRMGIDGSTIFFGARLPRNLSDMPQEEYQESALFNRNERRAFIWGHANGPDGFSAGENLDRAFSILQALVNIQAHLHRRVNPLPTDFRPSSIFNHGPNYYLFDKSKSEWSKVYWVADENHEKLWSDTRIGSDKIIPLISVVKRHRNRLFSSIFRARLVDALLNLNASWKAITREGKATYLWMALEGLYSDQGAPCDQQTIIRRATYGLEGEVRDLASDRLKFVAELRNSKVHNFSQFNANDPANVILQAANLYVVSCYLDLLNINQTLVRNENEFIRYVELTSNVSQLAVQKRLIGMAIRANSS